jgi:hypothetical protein
MDDVVPVVAWLARDGGDAISSPPKKIEDNKKPRLLSQAGFLVQG